MKTSLYFHTLRHLRLLQIGWLLGQKVPRRPVPIPKHDGRRPVGQKWISGPIRPQSLFENNRAKFLGAAHVIDGPIGWRDCEDGMLWLYNLHYFDDVSSGPSTNIARRALQKEWLLRWIDENPQGSQPGWDPYPTALRLVNWVRAAFEGLELPPKAIDSLALQANHLRNRLEHHLLANHLWTDAKGLVFAGLFLEGKDAAEWFEHGMVVLEQQVDEQILADGGHFERSPMYHAIIHEDLLDLIQVLRIYQRPVPNGWIELSKKMGAWSQVMLHPDGEIPFFNDAAVGIAASHRERAEYSQRLGIDFSEEINGGITALPSSGYFRIQRGDFHLLCDIAEIGPDYQPGHAHADTLSFELSFRGERFFVNTGTSCYGKSSRRHLERSSLAHNTVCIDDQDSSEVWGGFRVARRARIIEVSVNDCEEVSSLTASHDGYVRFLRRQIHSREWLVQKDGVSIQDRLDLEPRKGAIASFHLAPGIRAVAEDSQQVKLTSEVGEQLCFSVDGATVAIEDFLWAPEFGILIPSKVLRVSFVGKGSNVKIAAESPH